MQVSVTLDALAQRPELAQELKPETVRALRLQARIALAALEESGINQGAAIQSQTDSTDGLVGIKEAAQLLNLSVSYLAHKGDAFPFAVHIGRRRLYSKKGIQRYIDRQTRF